MIKRLKYHNDKGNRIFIFGSGKSGVDFYATAKGLIPNISLTFADNSIDAQNNGVMIDGEKYDVFAPDEIKKAYPECLVVITSKIYCAEIKNQLFNMGISEDNIVLTEECLLNEVDDCKAVIKKRMPRKRLNFVVDLAEHCNLNCQNCDHFSPLAEEHFTDIDQFKSDIKRISEIFDEDITHVDLEGGEPLLNPDVCRYIDIVHRYMPKTDVKIFSNGLLLPKMNDEFWRVCNEHNVALEITQYPIAFDYDSVENLAKAKGVIYHTYDGKGEKVSWHKPLDLEGKQDRYDSFNNCYLANGECTMLKNGKLYPCTMIPNIEIFNRYFNRNIVVSEKDYIDIYSDITKEEIYEFLCDPPQACRYCKVSEWTFGHKWKVTGKDIHEWT